MSKSKTTQKLSFFPIFYSFISLIAFISVIVHSCLHPYSLTIDPLHLGTSISSLIILLSVFISSVSGLLFGFTLFKKSSLARFFLPLSLFSLLFGLLINRLQLVPNLILSPLNQTTIPAATKVQLYESASLSLTLTAAFIVLITLISVFVYLHFVKKLVK